jgi:dolichol-phosphate mannosyltransferase
LDPAAKIDQNRTTPAANRTLTAAPSHSQSWPALSVVVPTYNERTRIAELVASIFAVFRDNELDGELVIVDDNSPDGTGALVDGLVATHPGRLKVVHRAGKLGLGTAVMEGFVAAGAPVVGVMDADFSHPPSTLPRLLDALNRTQADAVIGSRYIPGGGVKNWPLRRRLLSQVACLLAWPLTPVRDATSGFFLVRRDAVENVTIAAGGFKICLELLMRGRIGSVAEVPYTFVDRSAGDSKMSLREALGYLTQLRQLYAVRFLTTRRARSRYFREPPQVKGRAAD